MLKPCVALFALVVLLSLANAQPALTPRVSQQKNALAVAFFEQNQRVDLTAGSGVELRLPGDEFHGDPHSLVMRADIIDSHDIRVSEPGERLGLTQESGSTSTVEPARPLRQQEFEGDFPVELRIIRRINHTHPTVAEVREDDIAVDKIAAI